MIPKIFLDKFKKLIMSHTWMLFFNLIFWFHHNKGISKQEKVLTIKLQNQINRGNPKSTYQRPRKDLIPINQPIIRIEYKWYKMLNGTCWK